MDQAERDNWVKIAAELENSGVTEGGFYQRAKAIADGQPDPGMTIGSTADKAAVKYTGYLPLEGTYRDDDCKIG